MVAPRTPRARRARSSSPLRGLAHLLWQIPVYALPFSAFFMLIAGQPVSTYPAFYRVGLMFSGTITPMMWIASYGIDPILQRRFEGNPSVSWWIAGTHLVMSLVGACLALVLSAAFVPGFMVRGRDAIIGLTYSLIFGALFTGIALAIGFYRKTIEHAGSERELQLARRIQRSFLLSEFPRRSRIEVHAVNVSSKEVSGDFYDVVTPTDSEILLAIADVSGKGVPAALLSSMLQASLRTQAGRVASPAEMMATINTLACHRSDTGQFATFFLAAVHEPSLTLRFTNAGHNFPVLQRADGERRLLERGGIVIGMMEGPGYEEESIPLGERDRVVFYTDGVTEAARADGEMFGEERLYALLDATPHDASAEAVVGRVLAGVREFLDGVEPGDDITVMALRVLPGTTDRPRG